MLSQLSRQLVARGLAASGATRTIATSTMVAAQESVQSSKDKFLEAFNKAVEGTMLNPPNFPSDFLDQKAAQSEEGKPTELPKKLALNFYLPHESYFKNSEVDLVLIPAVTGDFGVMPGHVPTVAQLRPGVVSVHKELDKEVEKYFVSSGFAFVHNDSTADVCAVEAVKLDDLDPDAVRAGLAEYTAKLASIQGSGDDYEIAAAQIGVEVYSAMNAALGL